MRNYFGKHFFIENYKNCGFVERKVRLAVTETLKFAIELTESCAIWLWSIPIRKITISNRMALWMRYAHRQRSSSKNNHDYTKVNALFIAKITASHNINTDPSCSKPSDFYLAASFYDIYTCEPLPPVNHPNGIYFSI